MINIREQRTTIQAARVQLKIVTEIYFHPEQNITYHLIFKPKCYSHNTIQQCIV